MKLPNYKCNWCVCTYGNKLCFSNPFSISHEFGYESQYDGATLDVDLCPTCADELTNYIMSMSQIDSVTRADNMDWLESQ